MRVARKTVGVFLCAIILAMSEREATNFEKIECVFLDREGVINRKPPEGNYITHWVDFVLLPGAVEAIAQLNRSGRKVIVVTNQRGVALGLYTEKDVASLHARLQTYLGEHGAHLDGIYFCPHDTGQCNCRKPGTGMFEQAFCDFPELKAETSVMIGDSLSDIEAGTRAGMRTILIAGDSAHQKPGAVRAAALATASASSLWDCVERQLCPPGAH